MRPPRPERCSACADRASRAHSFCGVPPEEGEFSTFVNELKWDLPDVPWSWDYNPPPPPPLGPNSPAALYARMDPDGFELVREKLLECFPKLTYVASMTGGSVSGVATSEDGLGCALT